MLNKKDTKISLKEKMAAFEVVCKKAAMKLTQQRFEIFRELAMASDHPAAERLYKRLLKRLPTLSLDTVYRTLATLENYGLIRKIQTPESQARFEGKPYSTTISFVIRARKLLVSSRKNSTNRLCRKRLWSEGGLRTGMLQSMALWHLQKMLRGKERCAPVIVWRALLFACK